MGSGSWLSNSTQQSYATYSRSVADTTSHFEIFKSRSINDALNPRGIKIRESCDSEENPNSNAIIIGLDVTGSMGDIAHSIAKDGLGRLMGLIHTTKPVSDPHIMFMGIGDTVCDSAPLQVSQFEPDIRIIEQLNDMYIEGGGGGNNTEGYDLPWYFASQKTSIDCVNKRGKKGYLFTMGDELVPDGLSPDSAKQIFGDTIEGHLSAEELLRLAEEKYNCFHLIIEEGWYCRNYCSKVLSSWHDLMGNNAIKIRNYQHIPEIIIAVMRINEGENPEDVIASVESSVIADDIKYAIGLS